jgi:hypothetical protein
MPSKCKRCVERSLQRRWQPSCNDLPETWSAGEELMRAVECAELPLVEQLLRVHGAAIANHRRQLRISVSFALFCDKIWDAEGKPWPDNDPHQPFSPLRLVVFRISDCCLTPAQSASFRAIATLLISHNADAADAMDYFSSRYGRPDTCEVDQGTGSEEQDRASGLFRYVWGVLSAAALAQANMQQLSAS